MSNSPTPFLGCAFALAFALDCTAETGTPASDSDTSDVTSLDSSSASSSVSGSGDDLPAECGDPGSQACADALEASCVELFSEQECTARPDLAQQATGLSGNFRCVWRESVVVRLDGPSCVISEQSSRCYGAVFVGEGGPTCLNDGCSVQPPIPFYAEQGDTTRLVLTDCGWVPLAFAPCDSEGAPGTCDCFCG